MLTAHATRIERVIDAATDKQRQCGLSWYDNAYRFAESIAASTGYCVSQVVGVIAALSPNIDWERNKRIAANFCHGKHVPDQTRSNLHKAQRILNGEAPETVLESKWGHHKTLSFYRCIMGDYSEVCIDRHAAYVATGKRHNDVRYSNYKRVADAYRQVARKLNITPAQAQAIAWVTWRDNGKKSIG